ncbi:MAG: MFS transporter [Alphaproteobacteria bacterium]|nr:MFS transporter [Alphaproteobacteria bacterium]
MAEPDATARTDEEKLRSANRLALTVLGFCFFMGCTGRGLMEGFVVFLLPLSAEFGGDRAAITTIYSSALLLSGLASPLTGLLFDRLGPRLLYGVGLSGMGLALLLAGSASAIWHLQLAIGLGIGFGLAAVGNVPGTALVNRWFLTRQSFYSALIFSSFGVGVLLFVPFTELLIQHFGWRDTYRILGGLTLLLLVPALLLPWRRIRAGHPAWRQEGQKRHAGAGLWTPGKVLRSLPFWGLFCVFFFTSQGMVSLSVQAVAYLVEIGFTPLQAASAWGLSGIFMPLGMITFGWLDGVIGRRLSVMLSYATTILGILCMWLLGHFPNVWLLGAFVFLMGSSLGSRGPLVAATAMQIFRGPNAASIFGCITLAGGIGSALGSIWGGLVHDLTGGYEWVMVLSFLCMLGGLTPFLTIRALRGEK